MFGKTRGPVCATDEGLPFRSLVVLLVAHSATTALRVLVVLILVAVVDA